MTTTHRVRLRALVERTRVAVVHVAGVGLDPEKMGDHAFPAESELSTAEDTDMDDGETGHADHDCWEMDLARVYERTLMELGASLIANEGELA